MGQTHIHVAKNEIWSAISKSIISYQSTVGNCHILSHQYMCLNELRHIINWEIYYSCSFVAGTSFIKIHNS